MFLIIRMIKLAAFGLFGYFLFEAFRGISASRDSIASARRLPAHAPGQGNGEHLKTVPVYESDGSRRTQKVGRGVIT